MHSLLRTALAFALAPALGVLAASLVLALITLRSVDTGLAASLLPIAYLIAGVIGIPAFLLSRAWLPIPLWSYATVGLIAACFVSIPIMAFFDAFAWGLIGLFAGAASGVAFGMILGTKSNNRWRGP